ncbi:M2 family metallopeptidase [candidate division KSB1 bacterium]|nr:M2 family metallopeptidase [candidate division KSB1 bacterium]
MLKQRITVLLTISTILFLTGCGENQMENDLQTFIDAHVQKVEPIMKLMNESYWNASISGNAEDYDKSAEYELELRKIYSDTSDFAMLKTWQASGKIKDPMLSRQLDILYRSYLTNQVPEDLLKQIVEKGKLVEKNFSTFRGKIRGREVTDNKIQEILKTETKSTKRKDAWLASKQVGEVVANDILELVKLRNEAAKQLGYENYYVMSLDAAEQSPDELNSIFDELARLTDAPFRELKTELDGILAQRYGISPDEMMPWHYHDPFFQEGPLVYDVNLDSYYENQDVVELAKRFYQGIGLPVDDILARSDLYEKEGKNPHAFCTHIDRAGDVRVLCNVANNERWMETMLHELGHGVYDKNLDMQLPFLLREPAHIFTTEAIAMLFGRLSRNATWLQGMLNIDDTERANIEETVTQSLRLKQLVFARWCQVMVRFEQALYANPDQDLNTLWWDLVETYQFVQRPPHRQAPDWAAKIHFTIAPVYYHNYMLGELLASQLHFQLLSKVMPEAGNQSGTYVQQPEIGTYLKQNVFQPGSEYRWNEMIQKATGEPLNPAYFVKQFIAS